MINIATQINHWRSTSLEELQAARILLQKNQIRQGLFWVHLMLEKMLKAHVCKKTQEIAPRIHNLVRLSELAGLELDEDTVEFLSDINEFNLEGRYIEYLGVVPEQEEADHILCRAEELVKWLNEKL